MNSEASESAGLVLWASALALLNSSFTPFFHSVLREYLQENEVERFIRHTVIHNFVPIVARVCTSAEKQLLGLLDLDALNQAYVKFNEVFLDSFHTVSRRFTDAGINFGVLKGLDLLSSTYPKGMPRAMCDIDLIVREQHVVDAQRIFLEAGFTQGVLHWGPDPGKESSLATASDGSAPFRGQFLYMIEPVNASAQSNRYELPPFFKRVAIANSEFDDVEAIARWLAGDYQVLLSGENVELVVGYDVHYGVLVGYSQLDLWSRMRAGSLHDGTPFIGQQFTDLLFLLLTRAYSELMTLNETNLRIYLDALMVLAVHSDAIDWEHLTILATKYGMQCPVFYTLFHARNVLGDVVPLDLLQSLRPNEPYINRMTDHGDFLPKLLGSWACATTPVSLETMADYM